MGHHHRQDLANVALQLLFLYIVTAFISDIDNNGKGLLLFFYFFCDPAAKVSHAGARTSRVGAWLDDLDSCGTPRWSREAAQESRRGMERTG